jgi:hypothetical protein
MGPAGLLHVVTPRRQRTAAGEAGRGHEVEGFRRPRADVVTSPEHLTHKKRSRGAEAPLRASDRSRVRRYGASVLKDANSS